MLGAGSILGPLEVEVSRLSPQASGLPEAILAFAATILWVTLALIALIVFREPISRFLSTVGGRLSKISVAGIELELAAAPKTELSENASSFGGMDPQDLAGASTSQTLVEALSGPVLLNSYVVIDLGVGKNWLTSRLFIFAVMLKQVRGVRCFVFVDRSGRVPNEYLGTVSTENIRGALAQSYPWLDWVFAKAYKDTLWQGSPLMPMWTAHALTWSPASQVVQKYVALLKQGRNWAEAPAEPTFTQFQTEVTKGPWVQLGTSYEYGRWIDRELLFQIFKEVLWTDQIPLAIQSQDKIREVVNFDVPFLAVVRSSGQFVSLLDRAKVLEDLAKGRSEAA